MSIVAATSPILRAIPETGQAWDDPSEDLLFMLLEDIEGGQGNYLVVERIADHSGQTYAQTVRRGDGSYVVEYRHGDADHHYGTVVTDMRAAHALLTAWAFEVTGWRERADWSLIR